MNGLDCEFLGIDDLKELITFAKAQGIPHLKAGAFECEIPPKDVNEKIIEELRSEIQELKNVTTKLSMQLHQLSPMARTPKPFTKRVANG